MTPTRGVPFGAMSPEYLAEFTSRVEAELAVSISTPGPADPVVLARLPEVLHPPYVLADGLNFPFMDFADAVIVAAELDHAVPDDVLDPVWAWFGHDGWAVRYLCRRVPTGGLDFALVGTRNSRPLGRLVAWVDSPLNGQSRSFNVLLLCRT